MEKSLKGVISMTIPSEPIFTADITVGKPLEVPTANGVRRLIPITGGEFSGPDFQAEVLPGGMDWQIIRPDGVAELEAFYILKTSEGTMISVVNRGYRHGPKEVMEKFSRGEEVAPDQYYFRSTTTFEVEEGKYSWLNRTIIYGVAERYPSSVKITFYRVS
jgi:hypothetical protein